MTDEWWVFYLWVFACLVWWELGKCYIGVGVIKCPSVLAITTIVLRFFSFSHVVVVWTSYINNINNIIASFISINHVCESVEAILTLKILLRFLYFIKQVYIESSNLVVRSSRTCNFYPSFFFLLLLLFFILIHNALQRDRSLHCVMFIVTLTFFLIFF
jgi:hypothetical protein